jgi:signal transduction histidine kinase
MNQELIRQSLLFAGLSGEDIDWLARMGEPCTIRKGEHLLKEGNLGEALYIVIQGDFEVSKRSGNREVVITTQSAGAMLGEMSLIAATPHTASVRALTDGELYRISKTVFDELIATRPAATLSILRTVISRLRHTESTLRQSEKMVALGTLAAGLAHELNNPAAAARRSSEQLRDLLVKWQQLNLALGALVLDEEQTKRMVALREAMPERAASPAILDPLQRSDREAELQTFLEEQGIDDGWEIAPVLVAFGWKLDEIASLTGLFKGFHFAVVIRWLCVGCSIFALLDEVYKSTERISEIVKAVKSYSYLDQAPLQDVDVQEGLENTLVILRSKLKQGVEVIRHYTPGLPRIEAFGSELNQVWTNIIDNAIDAMGGIGEIHIKTYKKGEEVVVEISDNGPGISADILSKIFDPFFTTKPPGVGSGLGLHISYNIIQRHRGQIDVASQPGETTFRVSLPIRLSA